MTTTTWAGPTSATSGDAYPSRGAPVGIRRHVPDPRVVTLQAPWRREDEAPRHALQGLHLSRVHAVRRKPGAAVGEKRAPLCAPPCFWTSPQRLCAPAPLRGDLQGTGRLPGGRRVLLREGGRRLSAELSE